MPALEMILAATIATSLIAFVGALSLKLSKKLFDILIIALVAFSAGALLSGAFFHLLAESLVVMGANQAFILLFAGFALFFLIEKFLHWHHCHKGECEEHPFTHLILIGDGLHNFIDGLIIAASFMVSAGFGAFTTLLIIAHEVPQELGDFGVLVYGGFSRAKALLFNFLSQLTCVIGGLVGFFFTQSTGISEMLLPFAAGGFIYIAATDLVPELKKEKSLRRSLSSFAVFLFGIVFTFAMRMLLGG